jgi:ubiquinol-cytochrome c reductase cytochrome c1 subunit
MRKFALALAGAAVFAIGIAQAAEEPAPALPRVTWPHDGIFGTFDRASLQRGFQIYKEVCSNCHLVQHLHYRDLGPAGPGGGIGFTEEEVKALAEQAQVTDGPNDQGEMFQRPGRPSDPIARPFPNEQAARAANNGALPPDLSLITKAREGGARYVFALLNGYTDPPPDVKMGTGMYYNLYFPGHQIAMPPPLSDGQVTFSDGTPNNLKQEAYDVAAFLTWAAEPTLETRHRMGTKVFLFLLIATALFYVVKRKIWADVH